MLRFLVWRAAGLLAVLLLIEIVGWLLAGGPGAVLRGEHGANLLHRGLAPLAALAARAGGLLRSIPQSAGWPERALAGLLGLQALAVAVVRRRARDGRSYERLTVEVYRGDQASAEALAGMFGALHKRLLRRWWRRLLFGQPAVALEVHHRVCASSSRASDAAARAVGHGTGASASRGQAAPGGPLRGEAWFAVSCPAGLRPMMQAAIQAAYPNARLRPCERPPGVPPYVLRLKKHASFIKRAKAVDRFEHEREPAINRLLTVMGASGRSAFVQLSLTPAPALFERLAKSLFKHHEAELSRRRREREPMLDRSMVEDVELRGGLELQHRPLFFTELRVVGSSRAACEQIASELRAEGAENRLVERGTSIRQGALGIYTRRVLRGEGNPLPCFLRGVFASSELAALWQLPSSDYAVVPLARSPLPLAPAPPGVFRPGEGRGVLRDALGPVSIHPALRKQNTAVPGTVEQGKSSFLVATVAEDLRRERCAVIVFDPKGDAADAAVSLVPARRTSTLLDFARPTCGFNPLAAGAPADVIADYVVAALKNLFTDADIRASSDRYLRNAIIAVLAYDRGASLWDAARLLSVGEEGYAYRRAVGARVRTLPEFKEISEFFTAELAAQLADARSTTTAKLDAPVNKLARLLNSPSIKRILLNDSLRIDFDRVIAHAEVLVVKGALGAMGAGNTSVLMQLLMGMLDAALARQQDLLPAEKRVAVALKVDEAPLVINRGFAETIALKRSAGLETVACWQTDAQWTDRDVRDQLDALFAHRVLFATASARDARAAVALTMAEFSDTVRPDIGRLSTLGRPDVRMHLPRHHAIVSLVTTAGRQPAFIAETIPLEVDRQRLALHAAAQHARGARHLQDLHQPHWQRTRADVGPGPDAADRPLAFRGEPLEGAPRALEGTLRALERPRADVQLPRTDSSQPAPSERSGTPHEPVAIDSYAELVELDRAHGVRWRAAARSPQALEPDRTDIEVLELICSMGHVLSSQIHRRFNAGRAATTTQRRLKRLADAGLIERLQFHRRDGGGVPMCCALTARGRALVNAGDASTRSPADEGSRTVRAAHQAGERERRLRQARRDVHVAGWVLAVEGVLGARCTLRGPAESVLSPPLRPGGGQPPIAPGDLRLPGGRAAHDFLCTTATGERIEAERFETVRPDAVLETGAIDLLVEFDDRLPGGRRAAKLERYEHFLAGWSMHTRRYGTRAQAAATVVFVCRDRARAREMAMCADRLLCACRAYAGEYPFDWDYAGRRQTLFAAERDVHEGSLRAYGVPALPPEVRVSAAHGDPRAGVATAERREILEAIGANAPPTHA